MRVQVVACRRHPAPFGIRPQVPKYTMMTKFSELLEGVETGSGDNEQETYTRFRPDRQNEVISSSSIRQC